MVSEELNPRESEQALEEVKTILREAIEAQRSVYIEQRSSDGQIQAGDVFPLSINEISVEVEVDGFNFGIALTSIEIVK